MKGPTIYNNCPLISILFQGKKREWSIRLCGWHSVICIQSWTLCMWVWARPVTLCWFERQFGALNFPGLIQRLYNTRDGPKQLAVFWDEQKSPKEECPALFQTAVEKYRHQIICYLLSSYLYESLFRTVLPINGVFKLNAMFPVYMTTHLNGNQ